MGVGGEGGCPVPCSRAPRQGPGGELVPLQVAVHTPYLVLFRDLNRWPYGSQSKPLLTEPLLDIQSGFVWIRAAWAQLRRDPPLLLSTMTWLIQGCSWWKSKLETSTSTELERNSFQWQKSISDISEAFACGNGATFPCLTHVYRQLSPTAPDKDALTSLTCITSWSKMKTGNWCEDKLKSKLLCQDKWFELGQHVNPAQSEQNDLEQGSAVYWTDRICVWKPGLGPAFMHIYTVCVCVLCVWRKQSQQERMCVFLGHG